MKLNSLKLKLQSILAQFNRATSDKGLLSWESDNDLPEVGEAIALVDEEGNENPAEDGDYTLEDGTIIRVAEGKVAEIVLPEEPKAEEPKEEPAEPAAEEPKEEKAEEEPKEEPKEEEPKEDEKDARIAELEARIAELEAENAELKKKLEEPAAEPAKEEFEKITTPLKTSDKRLNNLSRILNA